jgi:hypothetical protein
MGGEPITVRKILSYSSLLDIVLGEQEAMLTKSGAKQIPKTAAVQFQGFRSVV